MAGPAVAAPLALILNQLPCRAATHRLDRLGSPPAAVRAGRVAHALVLGQPEHAAAVGLRLSLGRRLGGRRAHGASQRGTMKPTDREPAAAGAGRRGVQGANKF